MERFGTEVVREHQNTIQVCQNNVAAQAIGEVGKHRIHDREKSMEDDYSELDLERMKPRDNFNQKMKQVIEEMKVECERKIKEMVYECNQKLKTVEDEWNQKLKIKEDDCNQKLKIKDDDCNQKLKTKDDDCNQKLKTKDDDCNQKLAIKDDDCNQKLKIKEDDCNQKLRIKDDDCNQKLKVKEDDCNQKLKIKDNDCNQKLEKMKVELKRKIKEVEDDCDQKLKVKEDDCNQKLKVKEDDCNQKLQIKDDEYETLKRDLQNREVGMFCSKLTKDFQMAYPSNSICTYGLLWKWLIFISDYISFNRSERKGSAGESDPVFPMTAEENDEKSVARISIDTHISFNESDDMRPLKSDKCSEIWQKNGYTKDGVARTSSYGSKGRKKSGDLNHDDHRVGCCLKKMILTAIEISESFTKEGTKSTPIELPSKDEIDKVLLCIRHFFFDGLSDLQLAENQNENNVENKETQTFAKFEESWKEGMTSSTCEVKPSLDFKKEVNKLRKKVVNLNDKIDDLERNLSEKDEELQATLLQLGSLSVEHTKMLKKNKMNEKALFKVQLKQTSTQSVQTAEASSSESGSTLGAEGVKKLNKTTQEEPGAVGKDPVDDTPISVVKISREESSDREGIRLGNVPTTAVERSLYNNYKFLLLIMSQRLLSSDVVKLKEWAEGTFSIDASRDAIEIFRKLDQQEVISASNLVLLREFLEKILRIDLAHLIDCFMCGDYSLLRNTNSSFPRNGSGMPNGRFVSPSPQSATGTLNPHHEPSPTLGGMNTRFPKAVEVNEAFVVDRSALEATGVNYHSPVPACRGENSSISQRSVHEKVVADGQAYNSNGARNRAVEQKEQGRTTESRTPVGSRAINHSCKPSYNIGSNGQKHSKFQREDSQRNSGGNPQNSDDDSDDDVNEQWLCNHYKRRCHVKFACCNKYWPCHRCHNNESNCGQKKLKSIHTKFVKCTKCSTEQEFSERSQFCINCHTKFAKYFCSICKHLTGKDDKPYHCGKCGICRIHKHRSFHCDVCGVCLDVQLRDNHRCREGSAHDECCICLEDAFTGCQILPCSHKVHKECATRMIRSGITRCPICRESFAHKLEKRPSRIPHKQLGKE